MRVPRLPFTILALAPFVARGTADSARGTFQVDRTNLDNVMAALGLSVTVPMAKTLCPAGELVLHFRRIKDFHPDSLVSETPFLKNLLDAKAFVVEATAKGLPSQEVKKRLQAWPDLPPLEFRDVHVSREKPAKPQARAIESILEMVAVPEGDETAPSKAGPAVAEIDGVLRQVLTHVFADQGFRELESVWRGLRFLLAGGAQDGTIAVEIFPTSRDTIEDALSDLLVRLLNEPPCLLLVDLPFDSTPRSLELLEKIADFGETLLVPAITWIAPRFFFIDGWEELGRLAFLPHYLEEPAFAKWRRLRGLTSASWLTATCNRFLFRYPYGPDNRARLVDFSEKQGLWASPVWGLGNLISQSVVRTGWPTLFTDWQRVRLENLALQPLAGGKPIATETFLPEDRINQFLKAGILPLVSAFGQDTAFVPQETTVVGGSLRYQLLITVLSRFLFWCKDNLVPGLELGDLEQALKKAFALFWEQAGQTGAPQMLDIRVTRPDVEKPARVRLTVEPPRQILPSGQRVELEFTW
ncbi:MAG TPA: type VI secretion system contractile sheath large subunit [Syntrophobacteria bacterium]|nr:type VI secretion system contractile sheath large subunit [Syntrophobacteria bacterium]